MSTPIKTITSRTNEEIKLVAALKDKQAREEQKRFIAEGLRTCSTLAKSGMKLVQMYTTQEHLEEVQEFVKNYFITIVEDHVMQKMSAATTPSGILAVFEIPSQPSFSELTAGLVMANITDPGNMGTLIRSCAALNVKSVVIVDGADIWSPKVVQASAGMIGSVNILTPTWPALLKWKKDFQLYALVVKGGKSPQEIENKNILLVVGNEATGIPKDWLRDCNGFMTIPMPGHAESLNAAVAGSLGLYLTFCI